MKGYKAFEHGMICNGKQYAENTVFEEDSAVVCKSGMHFCKNPFNVLDYYALVSENGEIPDFAEVKALEKPNTDDGRKYCTRKLKVGAKLNLAGFVKACVEYTCDSTQENSSGDWAQLASSGDGAQLANSGDRAQLASSGDGAQLANSGDRAQLASSGDWAQLASSGDWAKLASSGDWAQLASSGDWAKLASSGDRAQLASSGDGAQLASSGDWAVLCCAGKNGMAKAKKGSWITLAEWKKQDGKFVPVCVKTEQVDGQRIKEDTFYILRDGEFCETEVEQCHYLHD